jgi:hypothetical protein
MSFSKLPGSQLSSFVLFSFFLDAVGWGTRTVFFGVVSTTDSLREDLFLVPLFQTWKASAVHSLGLGPGRGMRRA